MNQEEINALFKQLEVKGEKQVRQELAEGIYGEWKTNFFSTGLLTSFYFSGFH